MATDCGPYERGVKDILNIGVYFGNQPELAPVGGTETLIGATAACTCSLAQDGSTLTLGSPSVNSTTGIVTVNISGGNSGAVNIVKYTVTYPSGNQRELTLSVPTRSG